MTARRLLGVRSMTTGLLAEVFKDHESKEER